MRAVTCLALACVLFFGAASQAAQRKPAHAWQSRPSGKSRRLTNRIVSILQKQGAREAHWGIQVVSIRSGGSILSWNEDKLFTPASTAKLFTTATALLRLGPNRTYKTTVEATGPLGSEGTLHGDLVLVGRGDPNLSARVLPYDGHTERTDDPTQVLEELADQVAERGIRTVDGNLVVDDTYFVFEPYEPGWTVGDLVWGYGVPVSALAVNDNVVTLTILPGHHVHDPAVIRQAPLEGYYDLTNRIVTVARRGANGKPAERRISIDRRPGSHVLMLWGQIPLGDRKLVESVAMDDPARFAGECFQQELARRGIVVKGHLKIRRLQPYEVPDLKGAPQAPALPARTVVALHESAPLVESITVIHKVSQNLHAEMLLRTLGRERRNVGSAEAGLAEVNEFLKEIGVRDDQVELYDGSGLSRQSLVSPSAMVALLRYMYRSKYRSLWVDSLPISGKDGSLAGRLRRRSVEGLIHAKTGSVRGVGALAGYMIRPHKDPLAFAIFMNGGNMTHAAADGFIDRIVEEIAKTR